MTEQANPAGRPLLRGLRSWFRPQDFAWVAFIIVLVAATPEPNYDALILLPLLGAFQILEPRLTIFASRRGQIVSIVLKLVLSYLLIGYSHGLDSYYASIFLIPIVSAATSFQLAGVITVTAIACLGYFSFLFPFLFESSQFQLTPEVLSMACLRSTFYAIVAFVVFEQAQAKREEVQRTQEAVAQLANVQPQSAAGRSVAAAIGTACGARPTNRRARARAAQSAWNHQGVFRDADEGYGEEQSGGDGGNGELYPKRSRPDECANRQLPHLCSAASDSRRGRRFTFRHRRCTARTNRAREELFRGTSLPGFGTGRPAIRI